jgi:hypothetical protein
VTETIVGPGTPCELCQEDYGRHLTGCPNDNSHERHFDPEAYAKAVGYLRLADKHRAVDCVIRAAVEPLAAYLGAGHDWVADTPIARRAELYAVLKVAVKKIEAIADRLIADAKRMA